MSQRMRGLAALVAVAFMTSGCFGSFNTVRNLWKFNNEVSEEKWVRELVFLGLSILPVYDLAGLADALIFNSIEFWTGENPITFTAMKEGEKELISRASQGSTEVVIHAEVKAGTPMLTLSKYEGGALTEQVHILNRNGQSRIENTSGEVLLSAYALPDGGFLLRDAHGEQVALLYGNQVDELLQGLKARTTDAAQIAETLDLPQSFSTAQALR